MPIYNPDQGIPGTLRHDYVPDRTFAIQPGVLHLTDGEFKDLLFRSSKEETVQTLGKWGIEGVEDGVVETFVYHAEDPRATEQIFLSVDPRDPATMTLGTRVVE